jgi:hypothetical protein
LGIPHLWKPPNEEFNNFSQVTRVWSSAQDLFHSGWSQQPVLAVSWECA